jgi:hypothetical protein
MFTPSAASDKITKGIKMARNRYSSASKGTPQKASDERQDGPAVLRDRKDLLVGPVGGFELTVFSVKHVCLLLKRGQ